MKWSVLAAFAALFVVVALAEREDNHQPTKSKQLQRPPHRREVEVEESSLEEPSTHVKIEDINSGPVKLHTPHPNLPGEVEANVEKTVQKRSVAPVLPPPPVSGKRKAKPLLLGKGRPRVRKGKGKPDKRNKPKKPNKPNKPKKPKKSDKDDGPTIPPWKRPRIGTKIM